MRVRSANGRLNRAVIDKMILFAAVVVWLSLLGVVSFAPRFAGETRRSAQADLLAFGALGVFTAGFFWQLLFAPKVWLPAGGGDLAGFLYPTYSFAQSWITRGVLPLWNPYIFGGAPFVGDIQTALFYPPNLLVYFLSNPLTYRDLELLAVLHFYIAGAGMYALLRYAPLRENGRGLRRLAALAGALAFEFSDLFITHFGNLNLIAAAAWLPFAFLFFMRALETSDDAPPFAPRMIFKERAALRDAILGGVFLALAFFAGHIQPYLFSVLALALYAGFVSLTQRARWKRAVILLGVTMAVALGLNAATFLPAFELARLSVRSAFTYADAAQYSLPPLELVGILVPGFFGRGAENAWGPWQRVEAGYLGVLPLFLAASALWARRTRKTIYFALLAFVGLLLALGGYTILHGWLFQFAPGFGQLRAPARFVFLFDFGLAALAAIGLDALLARDDATRQKIRVGLKYAAWGVLFVALVSGALALGILILGQGQDPALFQRIANAANALAFFILLLALSLALFAAWTRDGLSPRAWGGLAIALIAFDLFSLGANVDVGISDPTLGYQRADVVAFLKTNLGLARIDSRTDVEGLWRPDTGLLYGLQDVYGDNPLVLNSFNAYWDNLGGRDSAAYQALNVKYVLARRGTPLPENFVHAFDGGGGITVWENKTAAPRAWFVTNPPRAENGIDVTGLPYNAEPVAITGYGPNEIVMQVNAPEDGYIILSEVDAPGWKAFVDGQETAIVRANNLLRAFAVRAGEHYARMTYEPQSFQLGALISGLTLLLLVVLGLFALVARRKQKIA